MLSPVAVAVAARPPSPPPLLPPLPPQVLWCPRLSEHGAAALVRGLPSLESLGLRYCSRAADFWPAHVLAALAARAGESGKGAGGEQGPGSGAGVGAGVGSAKRAPFKLDLRDTRASPEGAQAAQKASGGRLLVCA